MHLEAGQRRIEYADNSQRLFAAAQPMFIVFVQGVNHTGTQGIFLSIGYCFDFAVTFYAPYGFKVILVMNMRFRTRKNHGFMEGKPHAVFLQQHTTAKPSLGFYLVLGTDYILHIPDYHPAFPPNFNTRALTPFSDKTSAKLRSITSRPRISSSSSMVSAGSSFNTSSLAPDVSMTTPRSKAFLAIWLATSSSAGVTRPWINPRPRTRLHPDRKSTRLNSSH